MRKKLIKSKREIGKSDYIIHAFVLLPIKQEYLAADHPKKHLKKMMSTLTMSLTQSKEEK